MGFAPSGEFVILYSYTTPIGIVKPDGMGIFTDERYSVTTSKHQGIFRRLYSPTDIPEKLFRPMVNDLSRRSGEKKYVPNYKWKRETIGIKPIKVKNTPITKW